MTITNRRFGRDEMARGMIRTRDDDGNRWQIWPIRLKWGDGISSGWFKTHGFQTGVEPTSDGTTARGCMPFLRKVFGQTLHLGRLKIVFGRDLNKWHERELLRLRDIEHKYNLLLSAIVDGGFADKRTEDKAFHDAMNQVSRLRTRDEEFHEIEKATKDILGTLPRGAS